MREKKSIPETKAGWFIPRSFAGTSVSPEGNGERGERANKTSPGAAFRDGEMPAAWRAPAFKLLFTGAGSLLWYLGRGRGSGTRRLPPRPGRQQRFQRGAGERRHLNIFNDACSLSALHCEAFQVGLPLIRQ